MGVTITIALAVWFASSLMEYTIVKANPRLEQWFTGWKGYVISITIGVLVGRSMGINPQNAGFILGQFFGVATNRFTFEMWTIIFKTSAYAKEQKDKAGIALVKYQGIIGNAWGTIRMGALAVVAIVGFGLYILGLPFMAVRKIRSISLPQGKSGPKLVTTV